MDANKAQMLKAFLASLPEQAAARLAKAVEVDRLGGGTALPHDLILEGLRSQLVRLHAERTPTPLRLFCEPFADLLSGAPRKEKRKPEIARSSVALVWNWLGENDPAAFAAYNESARAAIIAFRTAELQELVESFWSASSASLREALATEAGRKTLRAALNGDAAVGDAQEMALLLAAGPAIAELQALLPRPSPALTEDHLKSTRAICDRVIETAPDAVPYMAVIAMRRLERPWEALRIPQVVARQTNDTLISSTDMGLAGEILFAEIETRGAAIRNIRPQQPFDIEALIENVTQFAKLSSGIVKEIEMRRDGKWGQRLMKERSAVAGSMDAIMERAARDILGAIPSQKSGSYGGGPRVPDVSRAVDPEKAARAVSFARLIVGCRKFAAAASFGAKLKDAEEEVSTALKSYNDGIVRELRALEGPARDIAEQHFHVAADLTAILFSEEEGDHMRRRGRAAMAVPVAA